LLHWLDAGTLSALASVIVIDVVLAGDNAVAVGMAAAGLPPTLRARVIFVGTVIATGLRLGLAIVATSLLAIVGLTLAGGLLLLFVAWKFYRELRRGRDAAAAASHPPPARNFRQAVFLVLAADVSMSLDNVLAIAGAARDNLYVLAAGLVLSVALMGVASSVIARSMDRHRWIGWVGLVVVTAVALRLIYDGTVEVVGA
jgi:YjbE family integral membrane protein